MLHPHLGLCFYHYDGSQVDWREAETHLGEALPGSAGTGD